MLRGKKGAGIGILIILALLFLALWLAPPPAVSWDMIVLPAVVVVGVGLMSMIALSLRMSAHARLTSSFSYVVKFQAIIKRSAKSLAWICLTVVALVMTSVQLIFPMTLFAAIACLLVVMTIAAFAFRTHILRLGHDGHAHLTYHTRSATAPTGLTFA